MASNILKRENAHVEEVVLDALDPALSSIIPAYLVEETVESVDQDGLEHKIIRSHEEGPPTEDYTYTSFEDFSPAPETPVLLPEEPVEPEEEIDLETLLQEAREAGRQEGILEGKKEAEERSIEKINDHRQTP